MNISKLSLIAGLLVFPAAPALAEAPDPFNKAERNAALTTETVKETTPPVTTPPVTPPPAGNTYVKPATRK